ncbi:MAG TPA: MFS transporter [Alphaproteobacteria bacterium]|nr:MFS transporter [Alphaproteobacteria bacterium]
MSDITAAEPSIARRLIAERDYMLYLIGRTLNTLGIQMQIVAIYWQVYQLTSDPMDIGFVSLSQFAPMLGLFLVAGYTADRFDRRFVMGLCYLLEAVGGMILYALAVAHVTVVWPIFLTMTVFGTARAFSQPAAQALVPNLVPRDLYPVAVAWNASAGKLAGIFGPALGGVLYAVVDTHVFLVIGITFALPVLMTMAMRTKLKIARGEPFNLESVLGGFGYIWKKPVVLGAISLDLFAVIFAGLPAMLPIFASDILHVGSEGLGVMRSMPAVGAALMALALTQVGSLRQTGRLLFVTVFIYGLSIIAFGLSTSFWLSLAALFIYGATDMISVYIRLTLVQIQTPDEMRGRVASVNAVSINASNELGGFRAGTMAAYVGAVPAVVIGGIVTLAVCLAWAKWFPDLRRADRLDDNAQ